MNVLRDLAFFLLVWALLMVLALSAWAFYGLALIHFGY